MSNERIEKSFHRRYGIPKTEAALKSIFTRAANRFLKDYRAAFGTSDVPEEINTVAEAIRAGREVGDIDCTETYDGVWYGGDYRHYDSYKRTDEIQYGTCYDKDEYGDGVYDVRWYFYSVTMFKKTIAGETKTTSDPSALYIWSIQKRGKYRYFCTHRPPSGGCIPTGYVSYEQYSPRSRYCGEATYNEHPDEKELYEWGLIPDPEWEQTREYYLQELLA